MMLLLSLAACGTQTPPTSATEAPAQEPESEMTGADGPSETLQGVYNELVADYSSYSQTKSYYDEYMPDVKYTEELGEDRFTIAVDSKSEYLDRYGRGERPHRHRRRR